VIEEERRPMVEKLEDLVHRVAELEAAVVVKRPLK